MRRILERADLAPERFRGRILLAGDPGWKAARPIYNERVTGRPAVIAQCAGVADVRAALRLAREHGLEVSVRCGGHHVAGWSSNDQGMVIDLTLMRGVRVDPAASTAWVGGGTLAADLLVEAGEFGLAPVTGASPRIGLAGLTMGLGEGYLTPRHGFGADNILALELVVADGRILRVSPAEHPDLFWAMRGAGANFGVVTALKLRLHPSPAQAVGGWVTFGARDARRVTEHLWEVMEHGSEHYFPLPVYRRDGAGRLEVSILPGHTGPPDLAEREVGALRRCGTPVSDTTRTMSYVDLVHEIPGLSGRAVWDLHRLRFGASPERQIDVLLEQADQLAPMALFNLWRTVPTAAPTPPSAAPRLPGITLCLMGKWTDAADDEAHLRWLHQTSAAFNAAGVVTEAANAMNHVSSLDHGRVRRLYGDTAYQRLAALKSEYDSENRFRRNYNIPPAGRPTSS